MANFRSVAAVGKSLETLLTARFTVEQPIDTKSASAKLIQTDDLDNAESKLTLPIITILLYRVDFNKTMRASWAAVGAGDGRAHLPVDMHYLLTAWAENAEEEHLLIGRTMQIIDQVGSLSGPLLLPTADWQPNEVVQLYLEDVATDDLMRTFESLTCDFRLSIPYLARIVVVSTPDGIGMPDVLTHVQGIRPDVAPAETGSGP